MEYTDDGVIPMYGDAEMQKMVEMQKTHAMQKIDRQFMMDTDKKKISDANENTLDKLSSVYGEAGPENINKIAVMPDFKTVNLPLGQISIAGAVTFLPKTSYIKAQAPVDGIKYMGDGITLVELDQKKVRQGVSVAADYKKILEKKLATSSSGNDSFKFHDISVMNREELKSFYEHQGKIKSRASSKAGFDKDSLSHLGTLSNNFSISLVQTSRKTDIKPAKYYLAIRGASFYDATKFHNKMTEDQHYSDIETFGDVYNSEEYKNAIKHGEVARLLAASLFNDLRPDNATNEKKEFHGTALMLPTSAVNFSLNSIQSFDSPESVHAMGFKEPFYGVYSGVIHPESSKGGVLFGLNRQKGFSWYYEKNSRTGVKNGWRNLQFPYFPSGSLNITSVAGQAGHILSPAEEKFLQNHVSTRGFPKKNHYRSQNYVTPNMSGKDIDEKKYNDMLTGLQQIGSTNKKDLSTLAIYDSSDNMEHATKDQLLAMVASGNSIIRIPITNTEITQHILDDVNAKVIQASIGEAAFAPNISAILTHDPTNPYYMNVHGLALKSILSKSALPAKTGGVIQPIESLLKKHPMEKNYE